uniref:Uncharacterized protein n=1 Tax=Pyxicephalus adspersus TaxID=30357 RepID=A0AAV3B5X5_PYXAD|nr:TPA: hypothetical protein GDO54_006768 [Pyxicephalus adspersus]
MSSSDITPYSTARTLLKKKMRYLYFFRLKKEKKYWWTYTDIKVNKNYHKENLYSRSCICLGTHQMEKEICSEWRQKAVDSI